MLYKKNEMYFVSVRLFDVPLVLRRRPDLSNVPFQFQFLKNCLKMMVSFPCGRISTCVFILG